jgi:hypothetical protein
MLSALEYSNPLLVFIAIASSRDKESCPLLFLGASRPLRTRACACATAIAIKDTKREKELRRFNERHQSPIELMPDLKFAPFGSAICFFSAFRHQILPSTASGF